MFRKHYVRLECKSWFPFFKQIRDILTTTKCVQLRFWAQNFQNVAIIWDAIYWHNIKHVHSIRNVLYLKIAFVADRIGKRRLIGTKNCAFLKPLYVISCDHDKNYILLVVTLRYVFAGVSSSKIYIFMSFWYSRFIIFRIISGSTLM